MTVWPSVTLSDQLKHSSFFQACDGYQSRFAIIKLVFHVTFALSAAEGTIRNLRQFPCAQALKKITKIIDSVIVKQINVAYEEATYFRILYKRSTVYITIYNNLFIQVLPDRCIKARKY